MFCKNCPHNCEITADFHGICKTRYIHDGKIVCSNYGEITSIALDPIEKKPLKHFMPGSHILSVGSWGCNMLCPWCQNDGISRNMAASLYISPEELVKKALEIPTNIGIAYTYNEPLISFDYVMETAKLARKHNLKNVLVTNGMLSKKAFAKLIPFIDALNVDLKTIDHKKYIYIGGNLETVLQTIEIASRTAHLEVTTLIVPGFNDNAEDMDKLAKTLAEINKEIVLHITRFFPAGNMKKAMPTPLNTLFSMADIARQHLSYVYEGNI